MNLVAVLFAACALVLILIVLIQKGRGGGLSAAFGGGGAGGLMGSKTGDFLTWVTIVVAALFLFLAVILGMFYKPSDLEMQAARDAAAAEAAAQQSEAAEDLAGDANDVAAPSTPAPVDANATE